MRTEKSIRENPTRENPTREKTKRSHLADHKNATKLITISSSNGKGLDKPPTMLRSNSSTQQTKKDLNKINLPIPKKRNKL